MAVVNFFLNSNTTNNRPFSDNHHLDFLRCRLGGICSTVLTTILTNEDEFWILVVVFVSQTQSDLSWAGVERWGDTVNR